MKILKSNSFINESQNHKITYFNEDKPIKIGGRKAPSGGRKKLEKFGNSHWDIIENIIETPKVEKDLSKYNFDNENLEFIGIQTTETGLDFMVFETGGDWEAELYFFIYWDGKDFRGYVPTRGNAINTLNKFAFGNGEDETINGVNGDKVYFDTYGIPYDYDPEYECVEFDDYSDYTSLDMCIDEFTARVVVNGSHHYTPKTKVLQGKFNVPKSTKSSIKSTKTDEISTSKVKEIRVWYDIVPFNYIGKKAMCFVFSTDGNTISTDINFNKIIADSISWTLSQQSSGIAVLSDIEVGKYAVFMVNMERKPFNYSPVTLMAMERFMEKEFPVWKRFKFKGTIMNITEPM